MKRSSVYFHAPGQVSVQEETLSPPAPEQVLVRTLYSAISPGTELLIYRGEFPQGVALDESLSALEGEFSYPLKYGYSAVGKVIQTGSQVDPGWQDRLVFAFQPHTSHFLSETESLLPLPAGISPQEAVFLPNLETAVNLVMDGKPLIGERVIVFGQGIVGLLTTALLAQFPLDCLISLDRFPLRRRVSLEAGAHASLDPEQSEISQEIRKRLPEGADLSYELSGAPQALDQALAATGYDGRIVIGSWYGQKRAALDLGGRFHRSRIRLISSQVSTIAPEFSGRWGKARRFEVAWEMIQRIKPARFITQCLPVWQATKAYELLDQKPNEALQVIFTYEEST